MIMLVTWLVLMWSRTFIRMANKCDWDYYWFAVETGMCGDHDSQQVLHDNQSAGKVGNVMKGKNKRLEFLKSIRLPSEEKAKNDGSPEEAQSNQVYKMTRQEEIDLQKELERRFDELFGTTSED